MKRDEEGNWWLWDDFCGKWIALHTTSLGLALEYVKKIMVKHEAKA